jgi:hypothetical protein
VAEGKLARAWGRGCALSLTLRLVLLAVVLCAVVGLIVVAVLVPGAMGVDQEVGFWIFLAGLIGFLFLLIAGVVVWAVWLVRRRSNYLDDAFTPLGLEGRMYLTNGRQYHGVVRGRQVDAYFYRGPILDLYVAAPLRTRFGISLKSQLGSLAADLLKREPLQISDPAFSHLALYALDERWARDFLDDPRARELILQLTRDEYTFEIRQLLFQPQSIHLKLQYTHLDLITPESVNAWTAALIELADIAERLTPARVTAEESGLEQKSRMERSAFVLPVVGVTCGFFALMTICILVITFALIYLEEGGF